MGLPQTLSFLSEWGSSKLQIGQDTWGPLEVMHSTDPETIDKLLNKKLPVFKLHPALLVVIKLLVAMEHQVVIFVVLDGEFQ